MNSTTGYIKMIEIWNLEDLEKKVLRAAVETLIKVFLSQSPYFKLLLTTCTHTGNYWVILTLKCSLELRTFDQYHTVFNSSAI